jgi:hypothetical protein
MRGRYDGDGNAVVRAIAVRRTEVGMHLPVGDMCESHCTLRVCTGSRLMSRFQ